MYPLRNPQRLTHAHCRHRIVNTLEAHIRGTLSFSSDLPCFVCCNRFIDQPSGLEAFNFGDLAFSSEADEKVLGNVVEGLTGPRALCGSKVRTDRDSRQHRLVLQIRARLDALHARQLLLGTLSCRLVDELGMVFVNVGRVDEMATVNGEALAAIGSFCPGWAEQDSDGFLQQLGVLFSPLRMLFEKVSRS